MIARSLPRSAVFDDVPGEARLVFPDRVEFGLGRLELDLR